ncbi:hypothetical protein MBLNU230_g4123t1 [Neophaeotheca triangularis]
MADPKNHYQDLEKGFSHKRYSARLPAAQQASRSLQAILGIPNGSKMAGDQAVRLWEMPDPIPYLPESRKKETETQTTSKGLTKPTAKEEDVENCPVSSKPSSAKSSKRSAPGTPLGAVKPLLKKPSITISKPEGETSTVYQPTVSPPKHESPATAKIDVLLQCEELAAAAGGPASPPPNYIGTRLGSSSRKDPAPAYWYNKLSKRICSWLEHPDTKTNQTKLSTLQLKEVFSQQSITFTLEECEKLKLTRIELPKAIKEQPDSNKLHLRDWVVLEIAFNEATTTEHAELIEAMKASTLDSDDEQDVEDDSSGYDSSSSSDLDSENSNSTKALTDSDSLIAFPGNKILAFPTKRTQPKFEHAYLLIAIPFAAVTATNAGSQMQQTNPQNFVQRPNDPLPPTPTSAVPHQSTFKTNLQALPNLNTTFPQPSRPIQPFLPNPLFIQDLFQAAPHYAPDTPTYASQNHQHSARSLFPPASLNAPGSAPKGTNATEQRMLQRMHTMHDPQTLASSLGAAFDENTDYAGLKRGGKKPATAVSTTDANTTKSNTAEPNATGGRLKGKARKAQAQAQAQAQKSQHPATAPAPPKKQQKQQKPSPAPPATTTATTKRKPTPIDTCAPTAAQQIPTPVETAKPTTASLSPSAAADRAHRLRFEIGPQMARPEYDSRVPLVHGRGVGKGMLEAWVLACARGEGVLEGVVEVERGVEGESCGRSGVEDSGGAEDVGGKGEEENGGGAKGVEAKDVEDRILEINVEIFDENKDGHEEPCETEDDIAIPHDDDHAVANCETEFT